MINQRKKNGSGDGTLYHRPEQGTVGPRPKRPVANAVNGSDLWPSDGPRPTGPQPRMPLSAITYKDISRNITKRLSTLLKKELAGYTVEGKSVQMKIPGVGYVYVRPDTE